MNRLGIENISVFGLRPVQFVNLAADLGCRYISTGLSAIPYNPRERLGACVAAARSLLARATQQSRTSQ